MGLSTRFVKDKVKTSAYGPTGFCQNDEKLLAIEADFYKNLNPKVFLSAQDVGLTETTVWEAIKNLWEMTCIKQISPEDLFNDNFRGSYSDESFIDNKESKINKIILGIQSRSTLTVKITGRTCSVVGDTTFVIFDYSWEFTDKRGQAMAREDGVCVQTWLKENNQWGLLGEFVEQLFVELI